MNRLLHWLYEFPGIAITAVLWPLWQFSTSTASSLTSLAQVSGGSLFGEMVAACKELGLPVVLIVAALFGVRELWQFFNPLIARSFAASARAQLKDARTRERMAQILENQKTERDATRRSLSRIERQGKKTDERLDRLINVVASGVGQIKGTDTVSVIDSTNSHKPNEA